MYVQLIINDNIYSSAAPCESDQDESRQNMKGTKRKTRRPNKKHQEQYPNLNDIEIREKLADDRKQKNRESAQASRENEKQWKAYLDRKLPLGDDLCNDLITAIRRPRVFSCYFYSAHPPVNIMRFIVVVICICYLILSEFST